MFREGYLSLCIYKNVHEHRIFFDIVVYRKVKNGKSVEVRVKEIDNKIRDLEMEKERLKSSLKPTDNAAYEWRRGTNLKPSDLKDLETLNIAAQEHLKAVDKPK